jgi:hypothetical protein
MKFHRVVSEMKYEDGRTSFSERVYFLPLAESAQQIMKYFNCKLEACNVCMHEVHVYWCHKYGSALRTKLNGSFRYKIIMHVFASFIKLSHPSSFHWITQGMFSIHLTKLTMIVSRFHVSCIQGTDYRPHFICGGIFRFSWALQSHIMMRKRRFDFLPLKEADGNLARSYGPPLVTQESNKSNPHSLTPFSSSKVSKSKDIPVTSHGGP